MDQSLKVGLHFGITSGAITTLGLIVGLEAGTHSRLAVIGGILTIAIADAMSDALGMHISQEGENHHTKKEIWHSTLATFLAKFFFALTFIIPILLFTLSSAIIINIIWGLLVIGLLSRQIAKDQRVKPLPVILEHLSITMIVVIATRLIGLEINRYFN